MMARKCKKTLMGGGIVLLLVMMAEITLRMVWGFGKMPLYAASDKWEYMVIPNQHGTRLGNRYYYNAYGQRGAEVDSTKRHVLGLGDSVIHGGTQTDQDDLATSLFTGETGIQMLNISAGSWGPDNCAAYLREYGTFNAEGVFLLVSSHDAYDIMDFGPTVGVFPSYPNKQYPCALAEVVCRYAWPRYIRKLFKKDVAEDPDRSVLSGSIRKGGKEFNRGFDEIKAICERDSIPLVVYLHADKNELRDGHYDNQGQEIITWCEDNGVRLIQSLDHSFNEGDYRDKIHINEQGQRKVANIMEDVFVN